MTSAPLRRPSAAEGSKCTPGSSLDYPELAVKAANEESPGGAWMQYPPLRWGGSGKFQLALSGCGLPLILSVLGATKLFSLPWNSVDCVSKQTSPVPRFPELKWPLLETLKRTGLLQRPEQGLACCGWQRERHGSILMRQVGSSPAWPSVRHVTTAGSW